MKTAKLIINYGRTINLGNYESERIDISLEKEIAEEDLIEESDKLFFALKAKLIQLSNGRISTEELYDENSTGPEES